MMRGATWRSGAIDLPRRGLAAGLHRSSGGGEVKVACKIFGHDYVVIKEDESERRATIGCERCGSVWYLGGNEYLIYEWMGERRIKIQGAREATR